MNKSIKSLVAVAVLGFIIPSFVLADVNLTTGGQGGAIGDLQGASNDTVVLGTGGQGGAIGDLQGAPNDTVIPGTGGQCGAIGVIMSTPTPTPTTPPTTGGGGSGGGSSYSSGGGSYSSIVPINSNFVIYPSSCPLLTDYMKYGQKNDASQVSKLQVFLKNSQGFDVTVNGIFDAKTESAVKAFQVKYLSDVMGPWEATQGSGFAYITTIKKINEIVCATPLTLSPNELSIIQSYLNREDGSVSNSNSSTTIGSGSANSTTSVSVNGTTTGDGSSNDNVASVGRASILSRFWNFILNLFR